VILHTGVELFYKKNITPLNIPDSFLTSFNYEIWSHRVTLSTISLHAFISAAIYWGSSASSVRPSVCRSV